VRKLSRTKSEEHKNSLKMQMFFRLEDEQLHFLSIDRQTRG